MMGYRYDKDVKIESKIRPALLTDRTILLGDAMARVKIQHVLLYSSQIF